MVLAEQARPLSLAMSEEHEMLLAAVRDFAQREIVPIAAEFDESGEFPLETVRKMGEMGLMGIEGAGGIWWRRNGHAGACPDDDRNRQSGCQP